MTNYLENYHRSQKEQEERKMVENLKKIIDNKINNGQRIMTQDIARILLKSQRKHNEVISEREVWSLAKRLTTNKTYNDYLTNEKRKLEESRKKIIKQVIEELKDQNEKITILKIRLTSGLPKKYLYSDEIKYYIDSLL